MRKAIAIVAGLAVLAAVNGTIWQRERQIETGIVVRLELAPVDPRSLMQGDYMALRYRLSDQAVGRRAKPDFEDGRIIVKDDDKGVARFVRLDDSQPLAQGEVALKYRVRGGLVKFATNAWFFQEGTGKLYEPAKYGEFRVSPEGEMLLVGMLDANLKRLGAPPG